MRFPLLTWRRLAADDTDHELIWLCVSVASIIGAAIWLRVGYPVPPCTWHEVTGIPCPSCGATRSVTALLAGRWFASFLMNPLVFLSAISVVLYDIYAAAVLAWRAPRLRCAPLSRRVGNTVRIAVLAAVAGNWAWLIHRGV